MSARRTAALAALLLLVIAGPPGLVGAVGEDPAAEVTEALRRLGPPGGLWGRLAIEEESPVGAWTPLGGVQVTLYPATAALVAELEQIRQSARTSSTQYESAVTRAQTALASHQGRIDRQSHPGRSVPPPERPGGTAPRTRPSAEPPEGTGSPRADGTGARSGGAGRTDTAGEERPEPQHPWRQKTDPAGVFAFDSVPSGDWLVVAVRVSPYAAEKLRSEPKPRQPGRSERFLPRAAGPAKEAELWVTRVRVVAGERVGLDLSDRARWLVGPLR